MQKKTTVAAKENLESFDHSAAPKATMINRKIDQ
jgi:hypothetical protein